ncbi:hypothetical protein B2G88_17425 [Natronolimnobius baerhuensis]|uniref:Methyltransferase n=1 Tax=Natronolimnobius baerhuensis TaxID=253108 RepID=A0A202E4X6_9EURY|nr:hypothetical protein B2G88_17425 [Natronolimnobius baerhuensis]
MKPLQHKNRILSLAKLISDENPDTVVEIGVCYGGTLYLWSRLTNADIIGIDLKFRGKGRLIKSFSENRIELVAGSSYDPKTVETVSEKIGGQIDFLFIDGDHSYEGVKSDFEAYSEFVSEGGIIAMDDVVATKHEVSEFWRELEQNDDYETMLIPDEDPGLGIIKC